jgi:hypothetical protein
MHRIQSPIRNAARVCLTACVFLTCISSASSADQPLQLLLYSPLDVAGSATTASTMLELHNPNPAATSCALTIENTIAKNTGKDAGWVVTFYGKDNKPVGPFMETSIGARTTFPVRVDLAHVVEAGETSAVLKCNNAKIADLKLVKEQELPLKVSLEGNPAEKPVIQFIDGSPLSLRLKNDDPIDYPLEVQVIVKRLAVTENITVGPSGVTTFTINPDSGWFSAYQSFFRSEQVDGILSVGYKPSGASGAYPSKTIPISAKLDYFAPGARAIWTTILVLVVLALGGFASTYLKVNLVNRVKAISIKKRLGQLARIIGEIGPQLNSQLRVSLWLERGRIESTLPHRMLFTPETAAVLAQSDSDTGALRVRVDWATQISDAGVRLDHSIDGHEISPSLADQVNRDLRAAQDLLKKSVLGADELQKIQSLVGHAVNLLNGAAMPDDDFEKVIAARLLRLVARFTVAFQTDPVCAQIRTQVPVPFSLLDPALAPLGSQFDRDLNTRKLLVIADMVQMHSADAAILECLKRQDFVSLPMAEQLLMELKEGISPTDLATEISANPPRVYVTVDRDTVRVNTPIMMKLIFNNWRYNRAAAKVRIECTWNFGHDNLTEQGWEIHHYFPQALVYPVNLAFKDIDKVEITPPTPIAKTVSVVAQRVEGQGHVAVEIQRWAVGFFVAIVGLFAGAKDKIFSLDTIDAILVVFLLGFSVDVAKSLLVQKDTSQP